MAYRPLPSEPPKMNFIRDPSLRVRHAVRDNKVTLLQRLQHKTDLRNTDRNRLTSLAWAAIEGSLEVFEWLLLDYGHDDQELSRDSANDTILHLLASTRSSPSHAPSIPHAPTFRSTKPLSVQIDTTLRMASLYHSLFPFLLPFSNTSGKSALHLSSQSGNTAFLSLLLDLGADPDSTDLQGNTPLHYASAWGHLDVVRVLLERGAGVGVRNAEGWTAGEYAYSGKVGVGMQAIAREVLETRRRRREGRESGSGKRREDGGRLRSGSVSTDASLGSGSASAHPNPSIQFPFPEVGAGARSAPSSRRPSEGHVSPPPLPTWTYTSPSIRPARFTHSSSSSSPSASQRSASSQNLPPIVTTYTSPPTRPAQLAHSSSSSSSPSVSQPQQPPSPYPPPQLPQTGIKFGTRTQSPQPYHSPSLHSDSSSNLRRPEMSSRNSPRSNGMGLETAPGPPTLVAGPPSFPPGPPTIAPGPPTLGAYLPTTRTLSAIITSTPPLPAPPAGGPISMRRANSAQTTSSAGSGVGMDRVPSGTSGRGTPI